MPLLTEANELIRESQAIQVFIKMVNDPSVKLENACSEIGISEGQYRMWISRSPDALEAIREYIVLSQRLQLFDIELSWPKAVRELIRDAIDPLAKPSERVTSIKLLRSLKLELEKDNNVQTGVEEEAHEFLRTGPPLQRIESRMASIEIEPSEDGSINLNISTYKDVIDGES